jgi:hypothetical protein
VGIGRVMSLFSSSVVGVKLSWLFTVTLLSIKRRGVWFGIYSIKGVFRYSGILPVRSVRGPRYPEVAGCERGRGRGGSSLFTNVGSGRRRNIFSSIWYCRQ